MQIFIVHFDGYSEVTSVAATDPYMSVSQYTVLYAYSGMYTVLNIVIMIRAVFGFYFHDISISCDTPGNVVT